MQNIAKYRGVEFNKLRIYDLIAKLVSHIMDPITPKDIDDIMQKRCTISHQEIPLDIPMYLVADVAGDDAGKALQESPLFPILFFYAIEYVLSSGIYIYIYCF